MAGWVSQTRKMLSTVISSLADDLEQAVQEFNDAVYRLNSPNVNDLSGTVSRLNSPNVNVLSDAVSRLNSPNVNELSDAVSRLNSPNGNDLSDTIIKLNSPNGNNLSDTVIKLNSPNVNDSVKTVQQNENEHVEKIPEEKLSSYQISRLCQSETIATQREVRAHATTKQPEPCCFHANLTATHSQSSSLLQHPEENLSICRDIDEIFAHTDISNNLSSESLSSFHLPISVSQPYLIQVSVIHPVKPSPGNILNISDTNNEHDLYPLVSCKQMRASHPQYVCPCNTTDLLKKTPNNLDLKQPGKVIRNLTFAIEGHNVLDEQYDVEGQRIIEDNTVDAHIPKTTQKTPSKTRQSMSIFDTGSKRDRSISTINEDWKRGKSSSLVTIERETSIQRWTTLSPFRRILSYAFTHLTNLVNLLTHEPLNVQTNTAQEVLSISDTEQNSDETPLESQEDLSISGTEQTDNENSLENQEHDLLKSISANEDIFLTLHNVHHSTVPSRTYSSDSFVIIDSSCFDGAPEEYRTYQQKITERTCARQEPGTHNYIVTETELSNFPNDYLDCGHSNIKSDPVTDVISSSAEFVSFDFRKLITDRYSQTINPIDQDINKCRTGIDEQLNSGYLIVGDGTSAVLVTNEGMVTSQADSGADNEDDSGSSVSIIILSDIDDDEDEFIFF